MKTLEQIHEEFNRVHKALEWDWILKNKELIDDITLDNDSTRVALKTEDEDDDLKFLDISNDLGDRDGVYDLLIALGFKVFYC